MDHEISFLQDERQILEEYDRRVFEYKDGPRAAGWGSERSQHVRNIALVDVMRGGVGSVLDVGCGLGDLSIYLGDSKPLYHGMDMCPGMVERARQRFPGRDFRVGSPLWSPIPLRSFDYVMASGIFNLETEHAEDLARATVMAMYELCRKAVAVNFLSDLSPWDKREDRHYYSSKDWFQWAAQTLTTRVVLRHDYRPNDFALYLYREPS